LERALEAQTVNSLELDSGLQISGLFTDYRLNENKEPVFIKFSGPCQLSLKGEQLEGHGPDYHAQGYSTPLGLLKGGSDPASFDFKIGAEARLNFASGIEVRGKVKNLLRHQGRLLVVAFEACRVVDGSQVLFEPEWGVFDMAVGTQVISVFGGPADRLNFIDTDDFVARRVPVKKFSPRQLQLHDLYRRIREARENNAADSEILSLGEIYFSEFPTLWLPGLELTEIALKRPALHDLAERLETHLQNFKDSAGLDCIRDGLHLAHEKV
jgi:phenylalanine-4-hydroxylase